MPVFFLMIYLLYYIGFSSFFSHLQTCSENFKLIDAVRKPASSI